MKSLEMANKITSVPHARVCWVLTAEGGKYAKEGTPEYALYQMLKSVGEIPADEVKKSDKSVGLNVLLRDKLAVASEGRVRLTNSSVEMVDIIAQQLCVIGETGEGLEDEITKHVEVCELQKLSKRKLVSKVSKTVFDISPTPSFSTIMERLEVDLSKTTLQNGSWRTSKFKPYNFNAAGVPPKHGSVHPLNATMSKFKNILIEMGFEEMPTQRWVESCFWNFDALFQPQTHPVRDEHDTFFLKYPANHEEPRENVGRMPRDYFNRVKKMHESGDDQSYGWECDWKAEEACKLILRTHTTAITSQVLRNMAVEYQDSGVMKSKRFFSIDRVFRNETLDATHLAEFHQVEGVVAEQGASLAKLMGVIKTFFEKVGIENVRFKPTYNPYTEPSMEIHGFHPKLGKWCEIGNSGVFRPEMLRPLGLPDDACVLGWGLSLERPTMIAHNIKDIRELFGPKAKLTVF